MVPKDALCLLPHPPPPPPRAISVNHKCQQDIPRLKNMQRLPTAYLAPPQLGPAAKTRWGLAATCLSELLWQALEAIAPARTA